MNDKELQFYDDKSELTTRIINFLKLCSEIGRDSNDELEDVIADAKKE